VRIFIAHGGWDTVVLGSIIWLVIIAGCCTVAFYTLRKLCQILGLYGPKKTVRSTTKSNEAKTE
jgi:hypothetical protein